MVLAALDGEDLAQFQLCRGLFKHKPFLQFYNFINELIIFWLLGTGPFLFVIAMRLPNLCAHLNFKRVLATKSRNNE